MRRRTNNAESVWEGFPLPFGSGRRGNLPQRLLDELARLDGSGRDDSKPLDSVFRISAEFNQAMSATTSHQGIFPRRKLAILIALESHPLRVANRSSLDFFSPFPFALTSRPRNREWKSVRRSMSTPIPAVTIAGRMKKEYESSTLHFFLLAPCHSDHVVAVS